ncbi:unnamed protein product [Rotaria sordida]|uniref:Uncharacterized protein n=1 Tax=Rotaria sordida TaxID=392033 RepID=A0A818JPL6_9BILA|nr:unnamed protein product [Rotaria sordida]CAF3542090.1 unnamed protein product [Rotaria sordida]
MFLFIPVLVIVGISFVDGINNITCISTPGQKNTSTILTNLRREMRNAGIGIYVVFSDDEHGSEYTQPYDKRRDWITGFRGSSGIAIISLRTAALWTDSRYFSQAEEELDCANWLLMRHGNENVPSPFIWLVTEAQQTAWSLGTTTVFTSSAWWSLANTALQAIGKQLQPVDDLVGRIWPSNERPKASQKPIVKHDIKYAGESVTQKLLRTTTELQRFDATVTIISALDEIAWQFNLRGADIPYNPFFKSYAIIYTNYIIHQPKLFVNLAQINRTMYPVGVRVFNYSTFWSHLNETVNNSTIEKILVSAQVSQAILNLIPYDKLILPLFNSPIERIKAQKNSIERKGMRDCQIRDAVARMKHIGWIEQQLNNNIPINETQSVDRLLYYQKQQVRFKFPSFHAISASGDRAALVHYSSQPATARPITKNQIYLLDAGSQYLDCTTDITRTHHFGIPKDLEKRAYTRVLQGVLAIADAVFPTGTYGRSLDYLGRMYLYRDGMTFGHGIGHGIGHFLSVHEGPHRIGSEYNEYEEPLTDGVFISDEPGFYKPGDFGIRIENGVEVVLAHKSIYDKRQFLRFDTITFVPYERSLIDVTLLTNTQLDAINKYHAKVAQILEPLLKDDEAALNALRSRTKKIHSQPVTTITELSNKASISISSPSLITFVFIFYYA